MTEGYIKKLGDMGVDVESKMKINIANAILEYCQGISHLEFNAEELGQMIEDIVDVVLEEKSELN